MFSQLRTAAMFLLLMTVLTGGVYPLLVTLVAQIVFPHQANGSLIVEQEKVLGSELIGQSFSGDRYFWGRLSATGPAPYNGASSSGSNLGPLNPALVENAQSRIAALAQSGLPREQVPVELVTASASGLDPHISPAAAEFQVPRIARVRNLPEADVQALVARCTESRTLGVLGEPRVNVLQLNLALDQKHPAK